jgi:hypothetical protein
MSHNGQEQIVMVYRRDMRRIRELGPARMVESAVLWCQISVHEDTLQRMRQHAIWFEYLGASHGT